MLFGGSSTVIVDRLWSWSSITDNLAMMFTGGRNSYITETSYWPGKFLPNHAAQAERPADKSPYGYNW